MPPPGGFEAVKYKRNLPFRGPSGLVILGAVTAVCTYGFYRVGKGNLERRIRPPEALSATAARRIRTVVPEWATTTDLDFEMRWSSMCPRVCVELQREKVWSRIHLVPLLLAEGDRDAYRRQQAALEREKEIMKDVKGWEVSNLSGPLTDAYQREKLMMN
ncbi:hypothetical protein ID866_2496 [Astraeus odoratus]|nr:hypothetical protein ID866_2496 [Astraeus odoratus]